MRKLVGEVLGIANKIIPDKEKRDEFMVQFQEIVSQANPYDSRFGATLKGSGRWIIALMFVTYYLAAKIFNLPIDELDKKIIAGIVFGLVLSRGLEKMLRRDR
jgi:hypothetical protein